MIPYWLSRTQLMLDDATVTRLMGKNVLVVGLGGVGGICAEMIARAGVGRMTIVDGDVVDLSNCNRQVIALHSTHQKQKALIMAERLRDINPEIQLTVITEFIKDQRTNEILDAGNYDYVADCIDTLSPKVWLLQACVLRKIKVVSALGAGGKVDPSQIQIADIAKTYQCNLGRYVRKYLHKIGVKKGITCVFTPEEVDQTKIITTEKAQPKKSLIGTISYMPTILGCTVASVIIRDLMQAE
jgi:tRNA threonylcarbamoyladenosine dehydratase